MECNYEHDEINDEELLLKLVTTKDGGIIFENVDNLYDDEKAKKHAKEQRKKERLHSLSVVEQEHRNRSSDDNTVSNKTPHVRNLSKKQKSKDGGEDNL